MSGRSIGSILAEARVPTPAYVYDLGAIVAAFDILTASFDADPHLVAYAVKANAAGPVVRALAARGAGADVVSSAELSVALGAGIPPSKVVWSGVAKTDAELDRALGVDGVGIDAVHVESVEEIERLGSRSRAIGRDGRVAFRIKPGIDVATTGTHANITTGHDEAKFGIAEADLPDALAALAHHPSLALVGITVHTGSQVTRVDPYLASADVAFDVVHHLPPAHRATVRYVDTGGGFGIDYGEGCPVGPADFVRAVRKLKRERGLSELELRVEPGRSLVAAYGTLVARVIQTKRSVDPDAPSGARRWLMIDAGMNDLMRPALYQARHRVVPVAFAPCTTPMRVVGPVCESSDDFGEHVLPAEPSGLVALLDAGAYGYSMASRYNGRELPAEVFVRDGAIVAVAAPEPEDTWARSRLAIGAPTRGT